MIGREQCNVFIYTQTFMSLPKPRFFASDTEVLFNERERERERGFNYNHVRFI